MQPGPATPEAPPSSATSEPIKAPRSTLISRNVTVSGHRTSVRLEPEMWNGLTEICRRERASLHEICTAVARNKTGDASFTAAIRVFTMAYYRAAATEEGHTRAGHGQGIGVGVAVASIMQKVFMQTSPLPQRQGMPAAAPAVSAAPAVRQPATMMMSQRAEMARRY